MTVLKMIMKPFLILIWLLVTALWLGIKFIVSGYSFMRAITGSGIMLLIIGTAVCYKDWRQVLFLISILCTLFVILDAGTWLEFTLEAIKRRTGRSILS